MDQIAVRVSSLVHAVEELRLYPLPYMSYVKAVGIAIPVVVLLHDTSDYWLRWSTRLPLVSWVLRKWRQDPDVKTVHLRTLRNLVLFVFFVIMYADGASNDVTQPSDYVEQRLTSAHAQRSMNEDIYRARRNAFTAADEVIGPEEMNIATAQQQRDAALRRRYLHGARTSA